MSKTKPPVAPEITAKVPQAATPAVAATPEAPLAKAAKAPRAVKTAGSAPVAKKAAAKPTKTVKAQPAPVAKPAKPVKHKLVRDSFTFPEPEYQTLVALKKRLLAAGTEVKKGELMRAGLALLSTLDDAALTAAVGRVEKLKTGRPTK